MVRVVELIFCDEGRAGRGVEDDPARVIYALYAKDGTLVASLDPHTNEATANLVGAYQWPK